MSEAQADLSGETPALYYRHSGVSPVGSLLLALVVGAAAAIPMAAIYSAGIIFIPFVKLRFLLTFCLGLGLGAIPAKIARLGHVRNNSRTVLIALLVTAFGYYASWVSWFWILFQRADADIPPLSAYLNPTHLWQLVVIAANNGTWNLGDNSDSVKGAFLWSIWFAEAAVIFGFAVWAAWRDQSATPYCEECATWCGKPRTLGTSAVREVHELRTQLESGQFQSVGPLLIAPPVGNSWMTYLHHTCPKCGELNTLTVNKVTLTKKKRGKATQRNRTVINKLLLHPGEAEQLLPAENVKIEDVKT